MQRIGGKKDRPVVERRGKNGECWLKWRGKTLGPYDDVGKEAISPSGEKWAAAAWRGKEAWLLLEGREHGPFHGVSGIVFSANAERCACRVDRGDGPELLIDGEGFFGPYEDVDQPDFSPDGRRWAADITKKGKWHGFVVDGEEFGPFPFQFFMPRFSPDSRHWFVVLDGGREDKPHSFILDGVRHGPFRIREIGFMVDGRFVCALHRRQQFFVFMDNRFIGPFRHEKSDVVMAGNETVAVLGYIGDGSRKLQRCVIACTLQENGKLIVFSANGGGSLMDAIVIHNADVTDQGVAAEYMYLGVLLGERDEEFDLIEQKLIHNRGKNYDQLTYRTGKGKTGTIFFSFGDGA
jgi:hypothetical protein